MKLAFSPAGRGCNQAYWTKAGCSNVVDTLCEPNSAPENQSLENEISFWDGLLSGVMRISGGPYPHRWWASMAIPDFLEMHVGKCYVQLLRLSLSCFFTQVSHGPSPWLNHSHWSSKKNWRGLSLQFTNFADLCFARVCAISIPPNTTIWKGVGDEAEAYHFKQHSRSSLEAFQEGTFKANLVYWWKHLVLRDWDSHFQNCKRSVVYKDVREVKVNGCRISG